MDDNKLGPKSNFIPEVTAGLKEAHDMVMDKYKTKIKKVISGYEFFPIIFCKKFNRKTPFF